MGPIPTSGSNIMITVKKLKDFLNKIPEHVEINLNLNECNLLRDAYDRPTTLILKLEEEEDEAGV